MGLADTAPDPADSSLAPLAGRRSLAGRSPVAEGRNPVGAGSRRVLDPGKGTVVAEDAAQEDMAFPSGHTEMMRRSYLAAVLVVGGCRRAEERQERERQDRHLGGLGSRMPAGLQSVDRTWSTL